MNPEQGPGEEEANFKAPETGGATTSFDAMREQIAATGKDAGSAVEEASETDERPAEVSGDASQRVDDVQKAEAMAYAGKKKRESAVRHRDLATGQAKETTSESIKRNLEVRPFGIGTPQLGNEEVSLYPEKYHEREAGWLDEDADKKEEKAGQKYDREHGEDKGRKAA